MRFRFLYFTNEPSGSQKIARALVVILEKQKKVIMYQAEGQVGRFPSRRVEGKGTGGPRGGQFDFLL